MSNHLSNHDISRFTERAGGDIDKLNLAFILQMTYVGAPTIYYGDEYGMRGANDPDNRRTFDWAQVDRRPPALQLVHKLTFLRNTHAALRTGSFMTLLTDDTSDVYAYARFDARSSIAVALNAGGTQQTVKVPVSHASVVDGTRMVDALSGRSYTVARGVVEVVLPSERGVVLIAAPDR